MLIRLSENPLRALVYSSRAGYPHPNTESLKTTLLGVVGRRRYGDLMPILCDIAPRHKAVCVGCKIQIKQNKIDIAPLKSPP